MLGQLVSGSRASFKLWKLPHDRISHSNLRPSAHDCGGGQLSCCPAQLLPDSAPRPTYRGFRWFFTSNTKVGLPVLMGNRKSANHSHVLIELALPTLRSLNRNVDCESFSSVSLPRCIILDWNKNSFLVKHESPSISQLLSMFRFSSKAESIYIHQFASPLDIRILPP